MIRNSQIHLSEVILVLAFFIFQPLSIVNGQNELDVVKNNWLQYSDAQNSLYHYLADQAIEILEKRSEEVSRINSLGDWQARQKFIRKTLMEITGPFPEKTPLNAKIIRTIEKDSFRVEHIIFESQPGFYVTSSLYIPKGLPKKAQTAAIIYCSGHTEEGYRSVVYQHVITNLVLKGFIVFAFDPVGQGERLEYFDPEKGKSIVGGPTREHSYPGNQAFITGSSQARYMIWDGIRAVDYLLTRKEIDPARIGITGRSGGGTQSSYIAAFDDRILASAPECYITTFARLLQTMGNQDAEQNFPSFIVKGLDLPDLLSVRAPKPSLMITTTRDIFSIQGAREAEKEISGIYEAYGKAENFGRAEDDTGHASTLKNREAMYAFFRKHLNNPGDTKDQIVPLLTKDELRVTSSGQVSVSIGGETVHTLNKKEFESFVSKKEILLNDTWSEGVISSAKKLSGFIEPSATDEPVFSGRFRKTGYSIEKYFVKGEGGYIIPYILLIPDAPGNKAVIYLNPSGKSADVAADGPMEWLVKQGFTVLAPDLIGTGETGPGIFQGDAYIDGESHNLWYASIVIGRSIVGIRTADVVKLTRLLIEKSSVNEIYGVAKKELSPVLLHASAFENSISRIALIEPYSSYRSLVVSRFYKSSFISGVVPGALKEYDLTYLAGTLAPGRVLIAGATDGKGGNEDSVLIQADMDIIKKIYSYKEAENQLSIVPLNPGWKIDALLKDWIK
ncbi:MAG TPA: xylan esterase [Bacteroidales bacterium]|nr:MAG: xylan esterase [Bacteroidetes bacterium GWC2_40_22]HBH84553.1 xylan esterase [Bacteroidales bacterium]